MLIGIDASRAVSDAPTGTETYSREMIRALLRIDSENQYRLYTRDTNPDFQPFGLAQARLPNSKNKLPFANYQLRNIPFPRLWTHTRLSLEMLTHAPDLLWVPAHVLPLAHPHRSIVTIHDLGNLYFPEAYTGMQRVYHRWSQEWNARVASHIFADSQATKDDLEKFFRIAPEEISVVYPAYDAGSYRPMRDLAAIDKVKAKLRVGKDYVLAVGTIHPRKNYARLAEVMKRLRDKEIDINLVIVGKKGWLYESIMKSTESLNLPFSFLEYVPSEDMPSLISGAKLFVFPSLHEGFGLPILEAQACGVPVACSNSASLPEVAGDGAIFFDPLDVDAMAYAIERGLTDDALRASLIANGFENVKRFGWEKSARVALDVMNRIGRNA